MCGLRTVVTSSPSSEEQWEISQRDKAETDQIYLLKSVLGGWGMDGDVTLSFTC